MLKLSLIVMFVLSLATPELNGTLPADQLGHFYGVGSSDCRDFRVR